MKVYVLPAMVSLNSRINFTYFIFECNSLDEAVGRGFRTLREIFPTDQGYTNHDIIGEELKPEYLAAIQRCYFPNQLTILEQQIKSFSWELEYSSWEIEYDNDTGPNDESFSESWTVKNGRRSFKCSKKEDALWLQALLSRSKVTGLEHS